jgi:hypothetical protein
LEGGFRGVGVGFGRFFCGGRGGLEGGSGVGVEAAEEPGVVAVVEGELDFVGAEPAGFGGSDLMIGEDEMERPSGGVALVDDVGAGVGQAAGDAALKFGGGEENALGREVRGRSGCCCGVVRAFCG